MPSVITFWQTSEDETDFLKYLAGTGEIIAYPFGARDTQEALQPQSLSDYASQPRLILALFTPNKYADKIVISSFPNPVRFSISPMDCPVLSYTPVKILDGRLTPSNLYVYWYVLIEKNGTQALERQPEDFVKWAKNVLKWVRKRANQSVEDKTLPLTPRAVEAMKSGLELIHY